MDILEAHRLAMVVCDSPEFVGEVRRDCIETRAIAPIIIANADREFRAHLEDCVASRLSKLISVRFDPNSIETLVTIMRDRVDIALESGIVERRHLETIADQAAGDARLALSIRRHAVESAVCRDEQLVTDSMIADAVPAVKHSIAEAGIRSLSVDQRELLWSLSELGRSEMADLFPASERRVESPTGKRPIRTYLDQLREYELVECYGSKYDGREYEAKPRVGDTLD